MDALDFDLIFQLLPDELLNDLFFNQIIEIIKNAKDIKLLGEVGVSDSMYEQISLKDKTNFKKNESTNALLYFQLLVCNGLISFALKKNEKGHLILKFSILDTVTRQDIKMVLEKSPTASRITTTKIVKEDDIIVEYDYDIHLYDYLYNEIPINLEALKDDEFAYTFGIPIEFAEFFRKNFRKYAKYLNDSKEKAEMEFELEELSDETRYQFKSPFYVSDLLSFFNNEERKKVKDVSLDSLEKCSFKENERINYLTKLLLDTVGCDGEIVIPESLYSIFTNYLYNMNSFIHAKGVIIKKMEDKYIIYYVDFTKGNTICIPCQIDTEHLHMLYYKSDENANVEGLKEFFGISPEEKPKR